MSEAQKAAEAYVKETDYIDDLNRNLAGNAFLAGAAWQRKRDAAPVAALLDDRLVRAMLEFPAEPITVAGKSTLDCLRDLKAAFDGANDGEK